MMSRLSNAVKRLSALRELLARAREEIPRLAPWLDALEQDDYNRAWSVFSGYGDVAEEIAAAPADIRQYVNLAGPSFMRMLDAIVDEQALQHFLERCGLLLSKA